MGVGVVAELFGVRLFRRRRGGERGQRGARGLDAEQRGIRREIELDAPRVGHLRHEADVGDRRRVAVAEAAGRRVAREPRLERLEARCRSSSGYQPSFCASVTPSVPVR